MSTVSEQPPAILLWCNEGEALAERIRAAGLGDKATLAPVALAATPAPEVLATAEILVGWNVPPGTLERMPRLRWIQSMATGVDGWMKRPDLRQGITLTRAHGVQSVAMAENVLGAVFHIAKRFALFARQQQEKVWRVEIMQPIAGTTLGILGLGAVGAELALRAAAMGMRVIGVKRTLQDLPGVERVYPLSEIDAVLAQSDYVAVLLPSTPATENLIDRRRLAQMKPTAWLINVARGSLVVDADMVDAVTRGVIAGAVLDTFRVEPLPADDPYWTTENILVVPHVGGRHPGRDGKVGDLLVENLGRFLAGKPLQGVVEPEAGY